MSQYFSYIYFLSDWTSILYIIPAVFIAFWAHGMSNAFVLRRYNAFDEKEGGRFTWNPLRYIDIIGGILMLVLGFGWAKTQSADLKHLSKKQKVHVHISGPLGNLVCALAVLLIQAICLVVFLELSVQATAIADGVLFFLDLVVWSNIIIFVTHIIPIPGFNGYKILKTLFFPNYYNKTLKKIEDSAKIIFIILAVVSILYYVAETPATWLFNLLVNCEEWLVDLVTGGLFSGSSWVPK